MTTELELNCQTISEAVRLESNALFSGPEGLTWVLNFQLLEIYQVEGFYPTHSELESQVGLQSSVLWLRSYPHR
jgi:hypothetical protein